MLPPHGGKLIDRYAPRPPDDELAPLPRVPLSEVAHSDLHNIAEGALSPLTGFMTGRQLRSVLKGCRLEGLPWTVPIVLDADRRTARALGRHQRAVLTHRGEPVATLELEDVCGHPKGLHVRGLFGTVDRSHPGVGLVSRMGDVLVGGKVSVFERPKRGDGYLSPAQTRAAFARNGWRTVVGFQTRNVLHRAHEYLQRCALELVDGLFLQPIVGWKKPGDFTAEAVLAGYRAFIRHYYPPHRVLLGTLKTAMRYAGPREAVFHAILRKNFGCTHFIVGRDHAGVGGFYEKYAAHRIFDEVGDLGIEIFRFKEPLYCSRCELIVTEKTCRHAERSHHPISGTLIRGVLKSGRQPKNQIFRPEVYRLLKSRFKRHQLFY